MTDVVSIPQEGGPTELPTGRFAGREVFVEQVRAAFAMAAHAGWKEIIVSDANFHDWPLGERAVIDALQAWAGSGRRFTMLACTYDEVIRRHARFVRWRATWEHIITCRRSAGADPLEVPSVWWSPAWVLQRLDVAHCAGVMSAAPQRLVAVRESLEEWVHNKSAPGFPSTTLGL